MNELKNIDKIKIPLSPERDWIWTRILISIDYYPLRNPTALQWALINILTNIEKFESELTVEKVAKKLAVEKSIIDEGLTNLIEEHIISLQPRKKPNILQNYSVEEVIKYIFQKYELITYEKSTKKMLLFYDYKDERTYSYQLVERPDEDEEENVDDSIYELVLLAIIEQIWVDLDANPHSLVGEIDYSTVISNKLLSELKSILLERIQVNFL